MRTTITLEDDVAASLKRLGKTRRLKFKALLNLVLREGIKSMTGPARKRKIFQTRSVDLGPCRIANVDNVTEVLAIAEGESFR
jgi:mRNA-degrading endonuclease RelE of RelBE toxin-antitoxin system